MWFLFLFNENDSLRGAKNGTAAKGVSTKCNLQEKGLK